MKPFTILDDEMSNTPFYRIACRGISLEQLKKRVIGGHIVAYSMRREYSLKESWGFTLIFAEKFILEFSSLLNSPDGWNEVGCLVIDYRDTGLELLGEGDGSLVGGGIGPILVAEFQKLVYSDKNFSTECGVVFLDGEKEMIVATGVSPGSVTALLPNETRQFNPELSLDSLLRVAI